MKINPLIPITSSSAQKIYPFEVFLPADTPGIIKDSKAKCNQVRTLDKIRIVISLGRISHQKLKEIEEALLIHLDMYFLYVSGNSV